MGECGLCPIFASYTLAFALQLRKKDGKTPVTVAEECQLPVRTDEGCAFIIPRSSNTNC